MNMIGQFQNLKSEKFKNYNSLKIICRFSIFGNFREFRVSQKMPLQACFILFGPKLCFRVIFGLFCTNEDTCSICPMKYSLRLQPYY